MALDLGVRTCEQTIAMFDLREPRPVYFEGTTASAPLGVARVGDIEVLGRLFRGEIRQLHFDATGALIVLAGRGVRRLDPRTLAETGRWLADREVLAVHPCGERLWVITRGAIFLAAFGAELGPAFAEIPQDWSHTSIAAGTRLAVPHDRGVTLLDAATGAVREFLIDEAWYATLFAPRRPDQALLSPSGRVVGVRHSYSSYIMIWDADTGAPLLVHTHVQASALLDDARVVHVDRGAGSVRDIASEGWTRMPLGGEFAEAVVRGDRLALADSSGGFALYDATSLAELSRLAAHRAHHGRGSSSCCVALSATHVASYAVTSGLLRVTEIGGATAESHDWIGGPAGLSLGQDGRRVAVFREWGNGRLDCVDLDAGQLVELKGHHEDITHSAITGDGRKVVVACGSILRARKVHVGEFGASESSEMHEIRACTHEVVTFGAEGYVYSTYTLRGAGHVGVHQAGSARAIAKLTLNKEAPWKVAVGHAGDELLVAWETEVALYDMTGKRPKPTTSWKMRAGAVALGPRGFLAFATGPDRLHIRTPGAAIRSLTVAERTGHGAPCLAFSRDGSLLFVGGSDGVLEVRRADDGSLVRELPLHHGSYVDVRCCGEAIWTIGDDGQVFVLGVAAPA